MCIILVWILDDDLDDDDDDDAKMEIHNNDKVEVSSIWLDRTVCRDGRVYRVSILGSVMRIIFGWTRSDVFAFCFNRVS